MFLRDIAGNLHGKNLEQITILPGEEAAGPGLAHDHETDRPVLRGYRKDEPHVTKASEPARNGCLGGPVRLLVQNDGHVIIGRDSPTEGSVQTGRLFQGCANQFPWPG